MSDNPFARTSRPLALGRYEYITIDAGIRREKLVATRFELGVLNASCSTSACYTLTNVIWKPVGEILT
jgi:hypothetical protein